MNKRILFIRNSPHKLNWNTYNIQGIGMGKAFCRIGYDFDFLYYTNGKEEIRDYTEINDHKIRIISKNRFRFLRTGICPQILNKKFLQNYDFVITCEYGQIMTYLLSKKSDNIVMYSGPYYNLFKICFFSYIYDFLFTKSINNNIKYKFVKSVLAKQYLEEKGYRGVYNIGVGLDIDTFANTKEMLPNTKQVVDYMRINNTILYVGALSERKNFPFLLSVFKKLRESNFDLKFVMIGKGDRKYIDNNLQKLSKDVRDNILFIERIENPQLKYIYSLTNAFLLPSLQEIFGMVLLEAMYLGAPVVSSENGGSLTLIRSGVNGFCLSDFNVSLWANTIQKLLDNDDLKEKMVVEARKTIEEKYNWNSIVNSILNIMNLAGKSRTDD